MNCMLAVFGLGGMEILVIFGAFLLLFGAKKVPDLMKGLGQGIREFKKASSEVTDELHRAIDEPPAPPKKLPPEGTAAHNAANTPPAQENNPAPKPQ